MPVLNLREIGAQGVISDLAPWDLPPNVLSDGMNFRLSAGKIQSAGGIDPVSGVSTDRLGHIAQSTDGNGDSSWVACGQRSISLFRVSGFSVFMGGADVSNTDATKWSTCQIGSVMFFNHPDLHPMYWVDRPGQAVPELELLPWNLGGASDTETWADVGYQCRLIRAHKNFLFALAVREDGDEYSDRLFWSHPAEPDGIPFSWRPTIQQPDSIAGAVSLGRGGAIIGAESLRDSFVIYSEKALSVMDFTGDSLGWRRRSISETAGLVSKEAIKEVKGQHIFFAGDDILSYDGNQMNSLMHNRMRSRLASRVNWGAVGTSWAAHYQNHNEVWFAVPEDGAQSPTVAYVFNYRDNNWGIRDLNKAVAHGCFGSTPSTGSRPWNAFLTTWADERSGWGMGGERPFEKALYGVVEDIGPPSYAPGEGNWLKTWDESEDTWSISVGAWEDTVRGSIIYDLDPGVSTLGGNTTEYKDSRWDTADLSVEPASVVLDWGNAITTWESTDGSWDQVYVDELPTGGGSTIWAGSTGPWFSREGSWNESIKAGTWDSYYNRTWDDIAPISNYIRSDTFLLRTDIPIGGHETNTTITRIYPYIEGTTDVQIRVGSQQNAGGEILWAGGYRNFTPGKDRKIDVRTTGELHAYEIRSSGTDHFDLTGIDIEYSMAGAR